MFASLSIYGLYTYSEDVFKNLVVPDGMSKDDVITQIVVNCSDFALIYPNYEFMQMLIGVWSTKELRIWENLYKSELIKYNPIENYDRNESITRIVNTKATGASAGNSITSASGADKTTSGETAIKADKTASGQSNINSDNIDSTVENGQTAYDSNTIKNTNKSTTKSASNRQNLTNTLTETNGQNLTNTLTESDNSSTTQMLNTITAENNTNGSETVINHTHGNIGVTTAQQMIEGFREVSKFCTYDYIVQSFKDRFCVQVF